MSRMRDRVKRAELLLQISADTGYGFGSLCLLVALATSSLTGVMQ